jgi:hypothetical protein
MGLTRTAFRYPGTLDILKSDFRESTESEIWHSMGPDCRPSKAYIELDNFDRVVKAYIYDPTRLEIFISDLKYSSEVLSTIHFALRSELER